MRGKLSIKWYHVCLPLRYVVGMSKLFNILQKRVIQNVLIQTLRMHGTLSVIILTLEILCKVLVLMSMHINTSLSSLDALPKVTPCQHFGSKVIGQKILHIPWSTRIVFHCMLRKHSKCPYTTLKLIQMRAEDNQRWRQIQNMPSLYILSGYMLSSMYNG